MKLKGLFAWIACASSLLVPSAVAAPGDMDITGRLVNKYRSELAYGWAYENYLNHVKISRAKKFLSHPHVAEFANDFRAKLQPFVKDVRVLNSLAYLTYKGQFGDASKLLEAYYFDQLLALREAAEHPRNQNEMAVPAFGGRVLLFAEVRKLFSSIDLSQGLPGASENPGTGILSITKKMSNCITSIRPGAAEKATLLRRCIVVNFPKLPMLNPAHTAENILAGLELRAVDKYSPGSVISKTGFVRGNAITVVNRNRTAADPTLEKVFAQAFPKLTDLYKEKYKGLSNAELVKVMRETIRSAEAAGKNPLHEAFGGSDEVVFQDGSFSVTKHDLLSHDKHPVWQNYGDKSEHANQVFPAIANAIRKAKSTVFIDMFFFGGTISLSLSDLLLHRLKENPNLKVVLLHDDLNDLGLKLEMRPVYNFLRAYMAEHPDRLLAIPANVYSKKVSGIPRLFSSAFEGDIMKAAGIDTTHFASLQAISDHSKVVVVDGDLPQGEPTAIIGSKNWADTSGALSNDESVQIIGPGAVIALDNYYFDIVHGIIRDWKSETYAEKLYTEVFEKGWVKNCDSTQNTEATSIEQKAALMVCPFDILKRYKLQKFDWSNVDGDFYKQFPQVVSREYGSGTVRHGENNWDASIRSILNQDLEAIYRAQKQIVISEQYVSQPAVVRALIKRSQAGVKVYIVFEAFLKNDPPGLPNVLYLEDMQRAGIKIRFKRHAHSSFFPGEFHGKTLSVDGFDAQGNPLHSKENSPILIIGSANKDFLTLTGAFREAQVEVIDSQASKQHDANFWRYYSNNDESYEASLDAFAKSRVGKMLQASDLTIPDFMEYARWMLGALYDYAAVR